MGKVMVILLFCGIIGVEGLCASKLFCSILNVGGTSPLSGAISILLTPFTINPAVVDNASAFCFPLMNASFNNSLIFSFKTFLDDVNSIALHG